MSLTPQAKHFSRLRSSFRNCFCGTAGSQSLHVSGKEVLANLKEFAAYDQSAFTGDPYQTAYNNGRQDVVKHILSILNLPDDVIASIGRTHQTEEEKYFDA